MRTTEVITLYEECYKHFSNKRHGNVSDVKIMTVYIYANIVD
jgi:hypothetical protein